jgi:hypothetical protein
MIVVYILIGIIIGSFITNYIGFNKVVEAIEKQGLNIPIPIAPPAATIPQPKQLKGTGRKGLYVNSFNNSDSKEKVEAEFEIYEIERSKTKSKIGVISVHTNKSQYNSADYKKILISLTDQQWIEDKDIEWLEESQELVREDKLNDLLD